MDRRLPEGWIWYEVQDIADVIRGSSPRPKSDPRYYGGSVPRLMVADVTRDGKYVTPCIDFLTDEGAKLSRPVPAGTLTIVCSGVVGVPSILAVDSCIHDGFLALKNISDSSYVEYLYYAFSRLQQRFDRQATHGGVFTNLTTQILKEFTFPLPPVSEQRKIAEILSTWGKTIELVGKQIEAKQRLKKGLMQQLLTGKIRFPGFIEEWREMQLGQFLKMKLRKVEKPKDAYLRLGVRSHGRGTFTTVVEDPSSVDMTHLYQIREGDLIVSITFAWEGAIAMVEADGDGAHVSHRFPTFLFDTKKVVPEFFRYLMHTHRFFYDLGIVSPGGAGRNRVMSKRNFLKIKVVVPSIEEQRKIGGLLTSLDLDIDKLSKLVEQLEKIKQGLMQKLLTGEVRVKV